MEQITPSIPAEQDLLNELQKVKKVLLDQIEKQSVSKQEGENIIIETEAENNKESNNMEGNDNDLLKQLEEVKKQKIEQLQKQSAQENLIPEKEVESISDDKMEGKDATDILIKQLEEVKRQKLEQAISLSASKQQENVNLQKENETLQKEKEDNRGFAYGDEIEEILQEKIMSNGKIMMQVRWKQRVDGLNINESMLYESQIKEYNVDKLIEFYAKRIRELTQENLQLKADVKQANQFKTATGKTKIVNPFLKEPPLKQKVKK